MNTPQMIATILICALATAITRFLPFFVFRAGRTPEFVRYLGRVLPYAVMGLLIVYCLKDVNPTIKPHALPEAAAIAAVALIHLWRRNTLLSILTGTAAYMLLTQLAFR